MKTTKTLIGCGGLLMLVALSAPGCATKKFVREQTSPIQKRVEDLDKKQSDALATLDSREQKDISRIEERAMTADNKANDAARAAQQADGKAAQAGEVAQNAAALGHTNQAKIGDLANAFQNLDNYKMLSAEGVLFKLNKAELTTDAKAKLDQVIQQASGLSRYILEVEGFTDKTGASEYNLALSRRRADTVVRYLVDHNVPLRRIHMIGLGADQAIAEEQAPATRKEQRRVVVKVWAPETAPVSATASAQSTP